MRIKPRNLLAWANALSLQSEAEMKLNRRNAAALHLYAELVGVSSQEFFNRFLVEFLIAHFGDPQIGAAEPFLGSFEFKDREKADRLAQWVKERDPDLEIEIRAHRFTVEEYSTPSELERGWGKSPPRLLHRRKKYR